MQTRSPTARNLSPSPARIGPAVYTIDDKALSTRTLASIRDDLRRAERIAAAKRDFVGLAAANAAIIAVDRQLAARRPRHVLG
jgi:hypothetical protein